MTVPSEGFPWQGPSLASPAGLGSRVRSGRKGLGLPLKRELTAVTLFPAQGPTVQPSLFALDLCEGVPAWGLAVDCGVADAESEGPGGRIESAREGEPQLPRHQHPCTL